MTGQSAVIRTMVAAPTDRAASSVRAEYVLGASAVNADARGTAAIADDVVLGPARRGDDDPVQVGHEPETVNYVSQRRPSREWRHRLPGHPRGAHAAEEDGPDGVRGHAGY